jgi:hypothetical protein
MVWCDLIKIKVQTLRNWVMVSSALASTAIVVIIGLIAFLSAVGTRGLPPDSMESINPLHLENMMDNWFTIKVGATL